MMNAERSSTHHRSPRPPLRSLTLTLVTLAATLLSVGRKRDAEGESQPQRTPAAQAHDHAGHDHGGGGHGEGEKAHADEVTLTAVAIARYGVKDEAAQLWILKPTVVTPARVAFNTEAMTHVGSPLRGRAVEVKVRLGETAKAGQEWSSSRARNSVRRRPITSRRRPPCSRLDRRST